MAEEKIKVNLLRFVTFKGVDYKPGVHEVEKDFADRIVRKNLGELTDHPAASETEDFEPLDLEETMKRFAEGDSSDIVFQSLRFHQPAIAAERRKSQEESEKRRQEAETKLQQSGSQTSGENRQTKTEADKASEKTQETKEDQEKENNSSANTSEGIPADFPQRHVFVKLGFKSVAEIQAKTKEDLVALDGIAEPSAEKALRYGKN